MEKPQEILKHQQQWLQAGQESWQLMMPQENSEQSHKRLYRRITTKLGFIEIDNVRPRFTNRSQLSKQLIRLEKFLRRDDSYSILVDLISAVNPKCTCSL